MFHSVHRDLLLIIPCNCRRRTGGVGKVFAMNATIISLMYLIGLTLWIIGLVELVAETRTTLIDHPDLSLSTSYEMASQFNARRTAILDVLYAYMVSASCHCPFPLIIQNLNLTWL